MDKEKRESQSEENNVMDEEELEKELNWVWQRFQNTIRVSDQHNEAKIKVFTEMHWAVYDLKQKVPKCSTKLKALE